MTKLLFRDDAYQQTATAVVTDITEQGHIVLNQTLFYPTGGGQPGDQGTFTLADGSEINITTTQWTDRSHEQIAHVPVPDSTLPEVGDEISMTIDWEVRYPRMKIHTALHLLSAVLPYPVTGGSIGNGDGRLDFDIPESVLDKEELTQKLQALVAADTPLSERWITDAELDANPELVKTMSVQPPRGSGQVRLIDIPEVDLQPCGGTHLKRTGEIGAVRVKKIEKKGKQNRRVRICLD
ncbi:MAG: alanyl-tRNA editing protein [Thiolinea sp.]